MIPILTGSSKIAGILVTILSQIDSKKGPAAAGFLLELYN